MKYGETSTLSSHEDLFEIIELLKTRPDMTRARLSSQILEIRSVRRRTPLIDLERAINLAVKIMIMVNCSTQKTSPAILENGENKTPWINDVSFAQFLTNAFPMTDHPNLNDEDVLRTLDIKSALMAKKLKNRAGLKFQPTDDLKSHLKLDRKNAVVEVYHHTAFLKENLRLTKDLPRKISVSDTLKLGAIPRQLALETLDSIQKILFPLTDAKSRALLGSLTSTAGFDPDCLRFDSASIRITDEKDIPYHYFGSRLADLYNELENPTPRGIEKWFERKSGARYVMMATLEEIMTTFLRFSSEGIQHDPHSTLEHDNYSTLEALIPNPLRPQSESQAQSQELDGLEWGGHHHWDTLEPFHLPTSTSPRSPTPPPKPQELDTSQWRGTDHGDTLESLQLPSPSPDTITPRPLPPEGEAEARPSRISQWRLNNNWQILEPLALPKTPIPRYPPAVQWPPRRKIDIRIPPGHRHRPRHKRRVAIDRSERWRRHRICGMSICRFMGALMLAALLVAGAVGGAVGGVMARRIKNGPQSSANAATPTSLSTVTASPISIPRT
ncbi:hypothetical protein B7494_g4009 [Chlorociboria aeruginascens]|nr:hypothetical protein B7494_g4009 [Chlorociboria aeruginascens]